LRSIHAPKEASSPIAAARACQGAPHSEAAYDLLDAMIAPEAGKWLIETQGYGHSTTSRSKLVEEKALAERDCARPHVIPEQRNPLPAHGRLPRSARCSRR